VTNHEPAAQFERSFYPSTWTYNTGEWSG